MATWVAGSAPGRLPCLLLHTAGPSPSGTHVPHSSELCLLYKPDQRVRGSGCLPGWPRWQKSDALVRDSLLGHKLGDDGELGPRERAVSEPRDRSRSWKWRPWGAGQACGVSVPFSVLPSSCWRPERLLAPAEGKGFGLVCPFKPDPFWNPAHVTHLLIVK